MLTAQRLRASNDFYSLYQNDSDHQNVQARTVGGRRVVHISESELLAIAEATNGPSINGSSTVDSIVDRLKTALEIRRLTSEVGARLTATARTYMNSLGTDTDQVESSGFTSLLKDWLSKQKRKAIAAEITFKQTDPVFSDPPVEGDSTEWTPYLPSSLSQAFSRACKHQQAHRGVFQEPQAHTRKYIAEIKRTSEGCSGTAGTLHHHDNA